MKIFLDTAKIEEIKMAKSMGMLDGVTTNPTLIHRANKPMIECLREICEIVDGPVSAECIKTTAEEMIPEAESLAEIHPNIVIKIPITIEGLKAIKALADKRIKTNCTLVFNPLQALMAAKAGASYVSPFVGRLDDAGHIGMDIVSDIITIFENYSFDTEVIVASIRNPLHVIDAALIGAHIATVPFNVLEQMVKHPLTDIGIKKFIEDYAKIPQR